MPIDARRPEATDAAPDLQPYLNEVGGLRPPDPDPVPRPDTTDDRSELPVGPAIDNPIDIGSTPAIDTPDPRLDGPAERTGGDR